MNIKNVLLESLTEDGEQVWKFEIDEGYKFKFVTSPSRQYDRCHLHEFARLFYISSYGVLHELKDVSLHFPLPITRAPIASLDGIFDLQKIVNNLKYHEYSFHV